MNACNRSIVALVLTMGSVMGGAMGAGQEKSWVGESVLPTKPAKEIKFGDRNDDKQVYYSFSGRWPFKVREDKEGWLRLHDGRREGWVDKTDFVLAREAFGYFDRRVQANAKDGFALTMRGGYWMEKKEFDMAIADFDGCIRLNPADGTAYHNRGAAWAAKKDFAKALEDYGEALRINPKSTVTYSARGLVLRSQQQFDKAIEDYNEAIRLEPRYVNALYGRGAAWHAKKDYDKAIKDFDAAISVDPKHLAAINDRGLAWVAMKEYAKGILDYDQALRLNPKNSVTLINRAVALKAIKQYGKAIADYEQSIRLDPKHARALSNLGWILATCPEESLRNGKRAVELATKACQLTKFKEPNYLDALAAACAEAGDFAQAIRYEKQALESSRFARQYGGAARQRLKSYEEMKPHRE